MAISSGDVREIGTPWHSAYAGGTSDGGELYDIGGVDVGVVLPIGAQTLEFDLQYVSHDYYPFLDPVRIFLNGDFVVEYNVFTELGQFVGGLSLGPIRHVVLDVSALSGTVTVRFQASDRYDTALDGGALIDNLSVPGHGTPSIASITPFGGHYQLGVGSGFIPGGGNTTANQTPVSTPKDITVALDAAGNASILPADVDNGSSDPDGDPITLSLDVTTFDCQNLGVNTVTLTVTDDKGAFASSTSTVTVTDVTAPTLTVPGGVTAECTSSDGTPVTIGSATASDICDSDPEITNDAPAVYGLGSTTVTWTATDASGNATSGTQTVIVQDTTAPVVTLELTTATLWPANHKMVLAASGISSSDICDASPGLTVSVSSDEPANDKGDGNTEPDWEIIDNGDGSFDVWLRAERDGRDDGRVYTVTAVALDGSGNSTTATNTVDVPHSQGNSASSTGKGKAKKTVSISQATTPGTQVVGETKVIVGSSTGLQATQGDATVVNAPTGTPGRSQIIEVAESANASPIHERPFEADRASLSQNYPNPFNPETVIGYTLAEASNVHLVIYNLVGQQVRVLVSNSQAAGQYRVRWDGRDASGYQVTSGVYLYRLVAGTQVEIRKMVLMK